MRRKIYDRLLEWKAMGGESALMIDGASRLCCTLAMWSRRTVWCSCRCIWLGWYSCILPIVKIGINFSTKERTITEWEVNSE